MNISSSYLSCSLNGFYCIIYSRLNMMNTIFYLLYTRHTLENRMKICKSCFGNFKFSWITYMYYSNLILILYVYKTFHCILLWYFNVRNLNIAKLFKLVSKYVFHSICKTNLVYKNYGYVFNEVHMYNDCMMPCK